MTEAKRKLSDIDFSQEGAHIALVSKTLNGGPANQRETLVFKGAEEINKAEVEVKMELVNFLRTFFHMFTDEAATLAAILGFDQDFFDEDFTFEDFNSLGATEVTLLKSANGLDKTEESLSKFINELPVEDLKVLKEFSEGFNTKHKDHQSMITDIEKALDEQRVKLEKAAEVKLAEANEKIEKATAKLAEIEKAELAKVEATYLEKAKGFGAEGEGLGLAMATVSQTEKGLEVIKALESAHKRLDEALEKEVGFGGEGKDPVEETAIVKAMKAAYPQEDKA